MSSTIFYRFKSQKEFSKITFDGSQMGMTVFDIKREIIQTEKLGTGTDFDLKISNANNQQEYEDDAENVPRGTSIIVQRKPPSRGHGKGSAARYVTGNAIQVSARQEFKKPTTQSAAPSVPPPPPIPGSSEDEAIRAMLSASSDQWQETQSKMAMSKPVFRPGGRALPSGPVPDRPLPQGYICYRCGQKGHWIQACPTNGDENFENRKRIKRTTGIPRSQLQKVEVSTEDGEGNVMVNAEGESVMFVPDSASWDKYQKNTKAGIENEVPEDPELACGICKKLMKNPMSVPCCHKTYCEDCIQGALLESDFVCPGCDTKDILLDQLKPEDEIKTRIDELIASKAESKTEEVVEGEPEEKSTEAAAVAADEAALPFDPMMMPPFPPFGMPPFPMMGFPPFPGMMPFMPPMPPMPMQYNNQAPPIQTNKRPRTEE